MENTKDNNIPIINDYDSFKKSYIDILNKKKVLYKYIFRFNNYKFKFKIISTYYEYLILCNNMLRDVTACNIFFGKKLFFEMLGKSFYYPYVLYIYDLENPYNSNFNSNDFNSLKFEKSSILDIEEIIRKGKNKDNKYFKKCNMDCDNSKIILNSNDVNIELQNYNLKNKNIVGYIEMYLLFHMGRLFDSRIERLVIDKNYRNRCFGLLIMYICIYMLKYLYHCNRCDLNVENEIALKIYKKLRFLNVDTKVYRLYLHCNYNFLEDTNSIDNDKDNIQLFIGNIIKKI
ncbi:conserved Plasmodium protein, unknown function [Plasmodium relictum]|uniref:Uncharacterized protein n=1 Tax=Plasmodium relictum TaxID=85471 RepID=A0A1J1H7C4_PLARL|nr:conserved Plasmodium protein, unknown function [Plasmodium relictum]CRH00847.1 conserved Plasmodium protein, unknown function [Plasmodium relictum]